MFDDEDLDLIEDLLDAGLDGLKTCVSWHSSAILMISSSGIPDPTG